MTVRSDAELVAAGFPAATEMVEMVNVDLLPFWDDYEPTDYLFAEKYRAIDLIDETEVNFVFTYRKGDDTQGEITVPKRYFLDHVGSKEAAIAHLDSQVN